MKKYRVYLAGPEVFLEDVASLGARKKQVCADHGFEGVMPHDAERDLSGLTAIEAGLAIYRANVEEIGRCDLLVANMTPFRGPSVDPGTAFEMGYMRGLGRPVFAYSNVIGDFTERTRAFLGPATLVRRGDGRVADGAGQSLEAFGLTDNLMMDGAVHDSDPEGVVIPAETAADPLRDLAAFEACVARAARLLR